MEARWHGKAWTKVWREMALEIEASFALSIKSNIFFTPFISFFRSLFAYPFLLLHHVEISRHPAAGRSQNGNKMRG